MGFKRALIGFDGSPPSEPALAVGQRLCAPDAQVEALTVAETHFAMAAGAGGGGVGRPDARRGGRSPPARRSSWYPRRLLRAAPDPCWVEVEVAVEGPA